MHEHALCSMFMMHICILHVFAFVHLNSKLVIHRLNHGYITVVFVPGSPLRSTKEGKFGIRSG